MPDLRPMAILLFRYHITDLETWLGTYARYAPAREHAGVKAAHVLQPDDDPHHILVILFFDTTEGAENFRTFLREQVWTSTEAVPGMAGEPQAMILHEVDTGS